jgi:hypothetical protein
MPKRGIEVVPFSAHQSGTLPEQLQAKSALRWYLKKCVVFPTDLEDFE